MTIKSHVASIAFAAALAAFGAMSHVSADANANGSIGVTVDNNQINFNGAQPIEMHGSVLVPLRGVFQALGADVDYDASTSTITAHAPGRHIVLQIGSDTAQINGQPQSLSQPAQIINGATMVPLRFVAEALGDYVEWSASTHMVMIQKEQGPPNVVATNRMYHEADQSHVAGTVRHINLSGDIRSIEIVTADGQHENIPVTQRARILRGQNSGDAKSSALSDLEVGDHVWVKLDDHGLADSVTATWGSD